MSLNWDATRIENPDGVTDIENSIMHGLIWYCMFVGLGEITAKNAAEFYARVATYEALHGPFLSEGGNPFFMKPEHIKRFIGLRCNVADTSTRKFFGDQMKRAMETRKCQYLNKFKETP